MTTQNLWTLVSTIDEVKNFHLAEEKIWNFSPEIQEYLYLISKIANEVRWLGELERKLKQEFWAGKILEVGGFRLANAIAVPWTLIRREVGKIILPNGETLMPTETNMGNKVIDPIGWASKTTAPSDGYWLLGKVAELRPNSPEFNEELYEQVMNRLVKLDPKWIAFEVWKEETALMPLYAIGWVDDIIGRFSDEKRNSDIPTAKYHGINS